MYSQCPETCNQLYTSDHGVNTVTLLRSSRPHNRFPLTSVYRVCVSRTWVKTVAATGAVGAIGLAFALGGAAGIGVGILSGMVSTAITTYLGEELDAFCCNVTISVHQDGSVGHSFSNFRRQ